MAYKIMIVDDHFIFRNGLKDLLDEIPDAEVIGEASSGEEFLESLSTHNPDIVFMDIKMPGISGIETTRKALEINPGLKILALSMYGEGEYVEEMLQAGALGYLLKNIGKQELVKAIDNIANEKGYFSDEILVMVTRQVFNAKKKSEEQSILESFTRRELEVLQLVSQGYSTTEIASQLEISPRTVGGHRNNMLSKSGLKNTAALISFAVKNHVISI
ncbi:MAG: response regulator transcription factor [Bacteroidales bacterium]|nr:response regulator transcription factor [Bacteroidales bacterium]